VYSAKVTEENIAKWSAAKKFPLERHTISDCDYMAKRLNEILDEEGRLLRALTPEEQRWIKNERTLCKLDWIYYATHYSMIKHHSEPKIIKFSPNTAQQITLAVISELEDAGRAIMIQQLKARQLGVSTLWELIVAHRVQFYTHVNAVVASSDPKKSPKMAQMMERAWQNQPWWLLPSFTKEISGEAGFGLIEFGALHSQVSIQHGSQFSGIARGDTPNVAHLSELADFINPEELVDASLIRAMHESAYTFLVLESTAKGRQNWWHNTWEFSKQYWSSGMSRLCPMFLPWFVGRDIYPTDGWLQSRPIPSNWQPSALTQHHAERAAAYVHKDPILRKQLGDNWRLPIEQMWFWEVERHEHAAKKELAQFYSEMPADDMEAFQSTNISAFDADTLTVYREKTEEPLGVFGFVGRGDQIPTRMQPDKRDIDENMPPINIRARWNQSIEPFECQLVPLKFHGYPRTDPNGKLFIWEFPEENEFYGLGIDTGDGVGLDRSVLEGVRKGNIERDDAQVCEFANPYINAFDLWPICMAVGSLYSTKIDGNLRQAKIVIDCLRNGESTQWELRKHGWVNLHQWIRYDSKKVQQSRSHKLGWWQNSWARAMMMDNIIKAIRDEWIQINSPYFVNEMADLERDEFRQSLRAVFGGNDDRIMALAMVHFSLHIMEIRGNSHSLAAQRAANRESAQVDPVYSPGFQATDEGRSWSTLAELEDRLGAFED
jgi:hypothetical protein